MSISHSRKWLALIVAALDLGALALSGCEVPLSRETPQDLRLPPAPEAAGATGVPAVLPPVTATPLGLGVAAATLGSDRVTTPWATPNAPLRTSTGKVTRVEPIAHGDVHLRLAPDRPSMRADLTITDWARVTVLNYWLGLQTPTPVASVTAKLKIVQTALNHQVTIGYYDTQPPLIVLVSVHKQAGDAQ